MTKKEILQKKQKAANYFTQKLLQSKAGKDIARVILFGSVARGETDDYSDIDLMVFTRTPDLVEQTSSDLSYDVLMELGERVEPHVYPAYEFINPQSYFVYHAVEAGKNIYSKAVPYGQKNRT